MSIIMPAYNEEDRIISTLNDFAQWVQKNPKNEIELIIVNDGSTDRTEEIIQSFIDMYSWIRLIKTDHIGMMNAIFTGMKKAENNLVGTLEADSPVNPQYFIAFLDYIDENDIIIGSRFLGKKVLGKSLARKFISKMNSLLFTFLFSSGIKDSQISFRLYKKSCIDKILPMLNLDHDGFKSSEIIVKAYGLDYKMKEIAVEYFHDEDSKAVPGGLKTIKVTFFALLAIFQLYFQSIREYRSGIFINCPVNMKKLIDFIFK